MRKVLPAMFLKSGPADFGEFLGQHTDWTCIDTLLSLSYRTGRAVLCCTKGSKRIIVCVLLRQLLCYVGVGPLGGGKLTNDATASEERPVEPSIDSSSPGLYFDLLF